MEIRDWTQMELSKKSGVSQRMISGILSEESGCSVETADALAHAFGLQGWHLIMPHLTEDLLKSKAVQALFDSYVNATPEGRALIDAMATRESKLRPTP
jgi:transcriptional regulator with XRE-family HTH domain